MDLKYVTDINGQRIGVIIPIDDWEVIQEKLKVLKKIKQEFIDFKDRLPKEIKDKIGNIIEEIK